MLTYDFLVTYDCLPRRVVDDLQHSSWGLLGGSWHLKAQGDLVLIENQKDFI